MKRTDLAYFEVVQHWLEEMGPRKSILDVGCFETPVASYGNFEQRYALDRRAIEPKEGVIHFQADWMDFPTPKAPYDVITCLQVIEHQTDEVVGNFCKKLLESCETLIASVPLFWTAKSPGSTHYQDPIDLPKIKGWLGDPLRCEVTVDNMKHRGARFVGMWQGCKSD